MRVFMQPWLDYFNQHEQYAILHSVIQLAQKHARNSAQTSVQWQGLRLQFLHVLISPPLKAA